MFSTVTKMMLKNVIRHTDTHNRIVEETDMWKIYEVKKHRERDPRQSFLYDDRYDMGRDRVSRGSRHAHMDDGEDRGNETRQSTYWQRQLQKAEEADPDRWGHSGYKELYPDKFKSDRSEDSDDSTGRKKKRKKRKEKKKHKEDNGIRKSNKRHRSSSESSDDSQDNGRKHHSKSSSRKSSMKSDRHKNNDIPSSSFSSSESDSNSRKRKYKSEFKTELKTVESETSLVKLEVEDFQWIQKSSNVRSRNLQKSEKDYKVGMKESHIGSSHNRTDRHSRDDEDEERKNRNDHGYDKICEKKKKRKSLEDTKDGLKTKKRTSSGDSRDLVQNSLDSGVDEIHKKKHKKHKNKHKSKKKKSKHSDSVSDDSSESDSERRYRKR